MKILLYLKFLFSKVFQIIQKAAFHSGYVFGMHLYMFSTDLKLGQ